MAEVTHPKILLRRALNGQERLWKVLWLWGIPMGFAAIALGVFAEMLRDADWDGAGAGLDVLKLLVYLTWLIAVWRCSGNVVNRTWTGAARIAMALALGMAVLTV
ncbi:MAG TPA: hypothetical protein VK572_16200 [Burkholderiales bacterium]|nr:hypothetical protein [Burkholderiales bacterium]